MSRKLDSATEAPASVSNLVSSRLLRVSNTLALYASRRYREEFGVTLPEWRVLSIIGSYEPTTARDVSHVLATDKAWVGKSADSLRRRGLVSGTADHQDGRRILLTLTVEGRKMYNAILAVARARQDRLLGCLPDGGAGQLFGFLDLLQTEADKMLAEHIALRGDSDHDV